MILNNSIEALTKQISETKSKKELLHYLHNNTRYPSDFSEFFNSIVINKDLKISEIIAHSLLDTHYAYQIINGRKKNPSRNKIIALCLSAHLNLEEINEALMISQKGILYPKNTMDAIIIKHVLSKDYEILKINEELDSYGIVDYL